MDDSESPPKKGSSEAKSGSSSRALVRGLAGASLPVEVATRVDLLAAVPAEEVWLAGLRSERTRRAYSLDVADFIGELGITERDELYRVTPAALLAWRHSLEKRGAKASTIRRKLSALSSLYGHLVKEGLADHNPVREVTRPRVNRKKGSTSAFSQEQARAILDAPPADTTAGKRDRAVLSVGLQLGARRSEISHLSVGDVHQHNGLWCVRYIRKGGEEHRVPLNPATYKRIMDYLEAAGHGSDFDGPLFRPVRGNQHVPETETRRHMDSKMVDSILRKWVAKALELERGFSAHSMRATFITRCLDNGCSLERVQRDVGHAHSSTTQLYDHREDNPEESAPFFATY